MSRRHKVGDKFEVDTLRFRVTVGDKFDGDQVLEMWGADGWTKLTFAVAFVIMDVLGQNEDARYPNGKGGKMLGGRLVTAHRDGWQVAWLKLQEERARADERREEAISYD